MPDIQKLRENLEKRGFITAWFETGEEAAKYLDGKIDGKNVATGGSMTIREIGLLEPLAVHNAVFSHQRGGSPGEDAAEVYLCSVNGLAETGELVNIDGTGNRVASTIYGRREVYFVVGVNKVTPTLESAVWRARNVAAPKNAQRLDRKTPCAAKGDRCYDCQSPDRICRVLTVLWERPLGIEYAEVVLVGQELGY